MSKVNYSFNTKTLSFEKAITPLRTRLLRIISFLGTASVIGVISVIIAYRYFGSPNEKQLARELELMKLQYDHLSRRSDQMNRVMADLSRRDNNVYRAILETDSIPDAIRRAGFGSMDRYRYIEGYNYTPVMLSLTKKIEQLEKQMYIQSRSYDEVVRLARNKEKMLASIPAIMPISNAGLRHQPGGFGWRTHPIYKMPEFHPGMDFAAPSGTEIYATGDGVVTVADNRSSGYGWHIRIDHGFGYQTLYAHMEKMAVLPGQKVKRGQVIGYVGSTGLSTAPHCHYEVHKNGERMNPINYYYNLTAEEYQQLVELSAQSGQAFD